MPASRCPTAHGSPSPRRLLFDNAALGRGRVQMSGRILRKGRPTFVGTLRQTLRQNMELRKFTPKMEKFDNRQKKYHEAKPIRRLSLLRQVGPINRSAGGASVSDPPATSPSATQYLTMWPVRLHRKQIGCPSGARPLLISPDVTVPSPAVQ